MQITPSTTLLEQQVQHPPTIDLSSNTCAEAIASINRCIKTNITALQVEKELIEKEGKESFDAKKGNIVAIEGELKELK